MLPVLAAESWAANSAITSSMFMPRRTASARSRLESSKVTDIKVIVGRKPSGKTLFTRERRSRFAHEER